MALGDLIDAGIGTPSSIGSLLLFGLFDSVVIIPDPTIIDAFGMYRQTITAFGRHAPTQDGIGRDNDVLTAFADEEEV